MKPLEDLHVEDWRFATAEQDYTIDLLLTDDEQSEYYICTVEAPQSFSGYISNDVDNYGTDLVGNAELKKYEGDPDNFQDE